MRKTGKRPYRIEYREGQKLRITKIGHAKTIENAVVATMRTYTALPPKRAEASIFNRHGVKVATTVCLRVQAQKNKPYMTVAYDVN